MKTSKFLPLLIVVALAACSPKPPATDAAPAPAAVVVAAPVIVAPVVAAPAPAAGPIEVASAADLIKGEKIYTATCLACHGAGVLGAPKFADKAAWQPRIAKGSAVLHTNALNGFNMMPAKGGNAALKDDDVKAAVDFMLSKAI
ncbi:MAG: c-type cytochrome [Pseudomonadota bacterium]|nr:c-type cytochrome [Pseudomonadota bacterium]